MVHSSALKIPDALAEHIAARQGEAGRDWLRRLPGLVASAASRWSLEVGPPFEGRASAAWVAPAGVIDGMPVVLKIAWPHREARTEAAGLRFFAGQGAVHLVDADEEAFVLVEERCLPGDDLSRMPVVEGNAIAADVLRALWRPPAERGRFELLSDIVSEWIAEFADQRGEYPVWQRSLAVEVAERLTESQPQPVLLHGDFNPTNVLSSGRGWLCIDCKPLIGDPSYDLAQFLANRIDGLTRNGAVQELRGQVFALAGALELDPGRISEWAFVKSLGWNWGADTAELFARVAGLLA